MTASSSPRARPFVISPAWVWPACAAIAAAGQVWALFRFYRRFVYDTPSGRIWGLSDDVYISACFGRSLVQGHGLVWFDGAPRIEGISNPLWSVLLGLLHLLPGFTESRLGLFVVLANALLIVAACALLYSALRAAAGTRAAGGAPLAWLVLPLTACNVALAYWSAEGFEVALIAVLALAMLRAALANRQGSGIADAGFGLLFVAGMASRMDFVLLAVAPIWIAWSRAADDPQRRARRFAIAFGTAFAGLVLLLLARKIYYGDWLPNTYYLKATQWPAGPRIARGVRQDAGLWPVALLAWLPLFIPSLYARLGRSAVPVAAGLLAFSLTVAYSMYVGGDAWGLYGGHDRHTVVGGLFLTFSLGLFAIALDATWASKVLALALSLCVMVFPVVRGGARRTLAGLRDEPSPTRGNERDWIRYAKGFERVSRPGARMALCPAGAIVYFSHRGGVDLLGKVEPYVAHLPVSFHTPKGSYCWKEAPGHNKEDDVGVFALRTPEFSRYPPPRSVRSRYVLVVFNDKRFYVLRDSPLVRWDLIPERAISEL